MRRVVRITDGVVFAEHDVAGIEIGKDGRGIGVFATLALVKQGEDPGDVARRWRERDGYGLSIEELRQRDFEARHGYRIER